MSTHAAGTVEVKGWDEKTFREIAGRPRLSHARVTTSTHGYIEGEGAPEYRMVYNGDCSDRVFSLDLTVGTLAGRSGRFLLQHGGGDDGSAANIAWSTLPGSGTGGLRDLRGEGEIAASHNTPRVPFTLDYDYERGH